MRSSLLRYVCFAELATEVLIEALSQCGGAVEVSTCPECQALIGGHSHRLTGLNARKVEFEKLAKGDATENPWAPGGYMANIF
jgi:hypothetical protein